MVANVAAAEEKESRDDETGSDFYMFDSVGFSISAGRLLQIRNGKP